MSYNGADFTTFFYNIEECEPHPLSDAEIAAIVKEINEDPKKCVQLKDLLEMTRHETKDLVTLIKRWIKEMKKIEINPRPYIIHYLICMNMHEMASM